MTPTKREHALTHVFVQPDERTLRAQVEHWQTWGLGKFSPKCQALVNGNTCSRVVSAHRRADGRKR